MEVGALRWILRHESRSYEAQQARKLCYLLTQDKGTWSVHALHELLPSENGKVNKGWGTRVPATAVIPGAQVMARFIGSKASVAGSKSP